VQAVRGCLGLKSLILANTHLDTLTLFDVRAGAAGLRAA
jgi:hypothetical protein